MNDQFFSISLPISTSSVAMTAIAAISSPVTIQYSNVFEGNYSSNIFYRDYSAPIRMEYVSTIRNKIEAIKFLGDNWDGYGAEAPDEKTINNSFQFLENLPEYLMAEITPDKVTPTPYGTIVFDFERNKNLISIELGEKNIGFFSEFNDNNNLSLDKNIFNASNLPKEIVEAFNKLYS